MSERITDERLIATNRIRELERENAALKVELDAPHYQDLIDRAKEAEATIERVESLPKFTCAVSIHGKLDVVSYDELQAALKSEPCSECSGSGETAYPPYSKTDPYGDLTTCKTCNGTGLKEQP